MRRRLVPWVPFAVAVLALVVASYKAMATEPEGGPLTKIAMVWWMPYVLVLAYGFVYGVPMLLLELARSVRRRSAAPPSVGRTAVALALPALVVAVVWPIGLAIAILFRWSAVAEFVFVHLHAWALWLLSVSATALWVAGAAIHWVWLARPVSVEGRPPYR
jgi:hypothetical protein